MSRVNMSSNHTRPTNDELWLAFQYVLGETSIDDVESFEQQMLQNTNLCAATAETSLLVSAISISGDTAEPTQPVRHHASARHVACRVAAVVSTLCCCAGLIVFLSAEVGDRKQVSQADLWVTAWADSAAFTEEPKQLEADVSDDGELDVPEWMLAGLSEFDVDEIGESEVPELNDDSPGLL